MLVLLVGPNENLNLATKGRAINAAYFNADAPEVLGKTSFEEPTTTGGIAFFGGCDYETQMFFHRP